MSFSTGVKSSGAVVKVFRHNDIAHLEKLLRFHIAEGQARTHRPWKKVRGRARGAQHLRRMSGAAAQTVAASQAVYSA